MCEIKEVVINRQIVLSINNKINLSFSVKQQHKHNQTNKDKHRKKGTKHQRLLTQFGPI